MNIQFHSPKVQPQSLFIEIAVVFESLYLTLEDRCVVVPVSIPKHNEGGKVTALK